MRTLPLLALLLAAPSYAGVISPVPGGGAGYQMRLPQLTLDLRAQMTVLNEAGSPRLMAGALDGLLSRSDVTPTQIAAARLIVEAVAHPAAATAAKNILKATPEGTQVGEDLKEFARRVRQSAEGAAPFHAIGAKLPELEQAAGIAWPQASVGGMKERLDAFFAGMKTGAIAEAPAVDGSGDGKSNPAPLRNPMQEAFHITVGDKALETTVALGELFVAIDKDEATFLDKYRPQSSGKPSEMVVRLENKTSRVSVTMSADAKETRLLWADFYESDRHPLLRKLAERFTFAAFERNSRKGEVEYEAPHIDADNMQLTTYGLRLDEDGSVLADETMHVYVGKNLLVTTHDKERPSVNKAQRLLAETGAHKTPAEMMVFLLGDTINRYSTTIDSLSGDFSLIAETVGRKKSDDSILQEAVKAGSKIDAIHETILRQRQVLKDLLSTNEFHKSEFVPAADLEKHLAALDHHLTVLDHYQERKNGLIELYRAKVSNELDEAMKRIGAISAMIAPAAIIGGLMGMNVALPGASLPYAFWLVVGFIGVVMAGLFVAFKRNRWL